MKDYYVLNKDNPTQRFLTNLENPYFKITKIVIPHIRDKKLDSDITISGINIDLKKSNANTRAYSSEYLFQGSALSSSSSNGEFNLDKIIIEDSTFNEVEISLRPDSSLDIDIEIHFENVNYIPLDDPMKEFKEHIAFDDNVKILFSAPFGQGKTTFLNYFFEENSNDYEVFKVYPVNYSISHNEDIFKYIKAEILFQLFGKEVSFNKETFSNLLIAQQFFINDPVKILTPLLSLISKIGKDTYKALKPLLELLKEYDNYNKEVKIDDRAKAEEFIKSLYEQEGSLFEDNFYTQLIRVQLEKLYLSSKRKNVLIIDDLDRMDPDHIFRILNVFAAHFDSPEFSNGLSNKFGFDKIILVCDYKNINKIYAHRYGSETDYFGYISKYHSIGPFYYDNYKAIASILNRIVKKSPSHNMSWMLRMLIVVTQDLVLTGNLTLRDLLKLLKHDANSLVLGRNVKISQEQKSKYNRYIFFNVINFLCQIYDIDTLILKIKGCVSKATKINQFNYGYFTNLGFPSLILPENIENGTYNYKYNGRTVNFVVKEEWLPDFDYSYYEVQSLSYLEDKQLANFGVVDFYEVLLLNAIKYKEFGGF